MLATSAFLTATVAMMASSVMGANFDVKVGVNGTKTYTPDEVTAAVGDTVTFLFEAGNHTVTQSTFAKPCSPAGFFSGFMPIAPANASGNATVVPPSFQITVNDTSKPIWVYCSQTGHCPMGMVMAINANDSSANSFSAFKALAMNSTGNGTTATGTSTTGASSGSSATASGTSPSAATSGVSSPSSTAKSGAGQVVAGAGLASVLALGLGITLA